MTHGHPEDSTPSVTERPPLPSLIADVGVVVALRTSDPQRLQLVADLLVEEGLCVIEVTMTVPDAMEHIRRLRDRLGSDVAIGAGTITRPVEVERAVESGPQFLLSPTTSVDVCRTAMQLNTPCITGAFTATEALKGWQAGASAVKLFPASLLGPEVISAFSAPLPDIPLIPMGGVSIGEASRWLRAGALAVGIGSPLLGDALTGGSLPDLRERARTLRAAVDGDGGRSGTLERDNLATLEGA